MQPVQPITRLRAVLALGLVALLALATLVPAGAREGDEPLRTIVKKRKLAPGVTFTRIVDKKLPRRTFVIRIAPNEPATVDMALADAALPARRNLLEIARANDALAAINGDFTDPNSGRPVHPFAEDGELLHTAVQKGPLFALTPNERNAYLGKPSLSVSVANRDTGQTWILDRWNEGSPMPGEIAGFSPVGGTLEIPPEYACSVRMLPEGPSHLDADGSSVITDLVVDAAGCTESSFARNGGVVLSAPPATDEATQLLAMTPGSRMRLRWSLGWTNVLDVIGGMPILVQDGRSVAETCSSSFCRRNPRTAIGFTDNGGVILVVVDGRRSRWSVGASLGEMAGIMRDLGAVEALNLDGGGSSTIVVEGEVVNKPSDGSLRGVATAVVVLPGHDPDEP